MRLNYIEYCPKRIFFIVFRLSSLSSRKISKEFLFGFVFCEEIRNLQTHNKLYVCMEERVDYIRQKHQATVNDENNITCIILRYYND